MEIIMRKTIFGKTLEETLDDLYVVVSSVEYAGIEGLLTRCNGFLKDYKALLDKNT